MNVQHCCFSWTFLAFSVTDDLISHLSKSEANYTLIVLAK